MIEKNNIKEEIKKINGYMSQLSNDNENSEIISAIENHLNNISKEIDNDQEELFQSKLELLVNDGFGLLESGKWELPKGSLKLSFSNENLFESFETREQFTEEFIDLLKKYHLPNGMFKIWSDSCSLCYEQLNEKGLCTNPRCPNNPNWKN